MPTRRLRFTAALVAWTLLVWTTRIGNIWGDASLTHGEKWGRTGLALSFTILAVTVGVALFRHARWSAVAVRLLSGWTIGVWATRSARIATADHSAAFITVHLVLAAISIVLASVAMREQARPLEGWNPFGRRSVRLDRSG